MKIMQSSVNKFISFAVIVLSVLAVQAQDLPYLYYENGNVKVDRDAYEQYWNNHPFNTRKHLSPADIKKMNKLPFSNIGISCSHNESPYATIECHVVVALNCYIVASICNVAMLNCHVVVLNCHHMVALDCL